jgi:hypothetical protein
MDMVKNRKRQKSNPQGMKNAKAKENSPGNVPREAHSGSSELISCF